MLSDSKAFSGFSTNDIPAAKDFYENTLGLRVTEENGMLTLLTGDDRNTLIYPKGEDHVPAEFTVLNFPVESVDAALDELVSRGVEFDVGEHTDERGVMRGTGPVIAWFKDPAGNVLSILELG